jgi:hypothetical protein
MAKIPVRTEPIRKFEETLGANAKSDADGYLTPTVNVISVANPLRDYVLQDKDSDASPNYYGFTDSEGKWYIMEETISAGADTYRFIKGSTNYTANWTGRAILVYDYFYNIF